MKSTKGYLIRDLGVERTNYRLNTINKEIGRITQIFSEQYLLLNNEIG
jgi:hypothetical protein